ncbi:MAG: response regulator, partial [Nitrospira sp.]|nr:response regulator [Nitrospira sp.]
MKIRLLIVDHYLSQREEIKTIFAQNAIQLYEATNATEGLKILKDKEVDLIICSPDLPDMDGLKFLNALQGISDHAHLPVLFISSQAQMDYKAKAFELGAQDFLTRPFQPEELLMR